MRLVEFCFLAESGHLPKMGDFSCFRPVADIGYSSKQFPHDSQSRIEKSFVSRYKQPVDDMTPLVMNYDLTTANAQCYRCSQSRLLS